MSIFDSQGKRRKNCFSQRLWVRMFFAIFFLTTAFFAEAQNVTVKGRVLTEGGQGIPNASVIVKGNAAGVSSDAEGNFEISAPANGTLVISSVGYTPREVSISGQTTINTTLRSAGTDLEQVVVVGYGTQRKKDVTGATVSVKGETLREVAAPNIYQQLQGRAAGLDIVSNSSSIGAAGEIRIRGNRSLTTNGGGSGSANQQNGPLFVVDGIPLTSGSINDINPNDIANIDILKDASATAIYGSRGANGVVIITTKRGRVGKAVTSYNGYYGISEAIGTYDLFNGEEYAKFKEDARIGAITPTTPNPTHPNALTNIERENLANGVSTNWQDLLLTKGYRTDHDINVTGGTEATQYSFGTAFFRETGVIPDQKFDRFTLRLAIDHKLSNRIKVGITTNNILSYGNRTGTNAYGASVRLSPLYLPYNEDGSINLRPAIEQANDANQISPLTSIGNNDRIKALTRRMRNLSNIYGEIEIIENLKFTTSLGVDWTQTKNSNYTGPNTVFNANPNTAGSNLSQSDDETWSYTLNNRLTYDRSFGTKHKIQVTALHEVFKRRQQGINLSGQGVPADYIQDYNFLLANTVNPQINNTGGTFSESGLLSYMGRAFYSYDDRYMITATVRADGSSVLAPGHQWVTFPAVSLGWNLSNEAFMQNITAVSNLKLRAGWGVSGNQSIGPYTTLGSLTSNFYNYGQGTAANVNYVAGYVMNTAPNPLLTWETTEGYNLGLDFALFNNRLSGSIEYYSVKTKDILLSQNLPRSQGVNSVLQNQGKTENHGLELSLSSLNLRTQGGFTWNTDANIFFSREKIVALQGDLKEDVGNGWFVGHPLNVIYDLKKIGIWQTSEAAQAATFGLLPGDIKIEDVDKSGTINPADRQVLGNFQPDFVAGLSNRFAYKNFDLNVVLFGRFGQDVVVTYLTADGGAQGYPFFMNSRVNQYKINYWTPDNPTNEFPQPDASRDALQYTSTLSYRDGSFIKIRTMNLGYNIPASIVNRAGLSSLRVYFSAQNPFILWAPLVKEGLGIDPEGNGNGNTVSGGAGGLAVSNRAVTVGMGVPPSRQFIFGLNLKF